MKAPRKTGALPLIEPIEIVRLRGLLLDHLGRTVAAADADLARLHRLGNLAHEINVQESVLEMRALDLDMVGELEHALEGARGDTLIEGLALLLVGLGLFLAADRQRVL